MTRIRGDHFVYAVAENKPAVEHRDPCLIERHPFAIEVDHLYLQPCRRLGATRKKSAVAKRVWQMLQHLRLRRLLLPLYLSHSRMLSQVRPKNPAIGTSCSATTGYSPSGLSCSVSL